MRSSQHQSRALVVYESEFGDTRAIANAIGAGLMTGIARVDVVRADLAPCELADVDLVVVGAPTHNFGLPRPRTRASARRRGAERVVDSGVREWLEVLSGPGHPVRAAAFDTHAQGPMAGTARRAIARGLRRRGIHVDSSKGFAVTRTSGPLADGSLQEARRWGITLAST